VIRRLVLWGKVRIHLVEVGHEEVRIATTEPGTSLAKRDRMLLKMVVGCEGCVGGY